MLEMKMELDALLPGQRPNSKDQRLETREPETREPETSSSAEGRSLHLGIEIH